MSHVDSGLQAWRQRSNHNRMIEIQGRPPPPSEGPVEIAYFGSSAFRITSPGGITVMLDPWRNLPTGKWDWYFFDFPPVAVDIGVSTHAHFDHDALHRLDAHVLLDRLIGTYELADVRITGIADKHATDSSDAIYDFKLIHRVFHGVDVEPPNNPRSWDHCLILVEAGGLRLLHWGDNRPDPPAAVWNALGRVDVLFIPIDGSQHVMGHRAAESIIDRLRPRVVVPNHYYIWNVTQRQSTLQRADAWVESRPHAVRLDAPRLVLEREHITEFDRQVHFFGDHVAFDTERWHAAEGAAM